MREDSEQRLRMLIDTLQLAPHPEGGLFRQVFKSRTSVNPQDDRRSRAAFTTIYYLLAQNETSRWHRVRSDEVWHLYEGDGLELLLAPPDMSTVERHHLDAVGPSSQPVATVPANWWQAARPLGAYALAGCTVAPGFEFEDLEFLSGNASARVHLEKHLSQYVELL